MNNHNDIQRMPKDEDVTDINLGSSRVSVVTITPENVDYLVEVALRMYANEPCRICGAMLTMDDIRHGVVFAGYSTDNVTRAAHGECWERSPGINGLPNDDWVHQ